MNMNTELYAIADVAGQQVVLQPGKVISVPKLDLEVGAIYQIDKVLYLKDSKKVKIGTPYIKGLKINSTVKDQRRSDKVIVFKKKRRKGYKVKKGHRQPFTMIEISDFSQKETPKKTTKKPAASTKTPVKPKTPAKPKTSAPKQKKEETK